MRTKPLGNSPVLIPEVGMGTWNYQGGIAPLRRGIELGATLIDTAESYQTEPMVGEVLQGRREEVFLATKVSAANFRRPDLLRAADQSLQKLRTDHLDLYQLHHPNEAIPLEETLGAMEDLVDAGKVRFIGVSNFSLKQLQQAQQTTRKHPIVSNQVRFNLADRTITGGLLEYCQTHRLTVIAYSPLGREFQRILDSDPNDILGRLAKETGHSPAQIALNWCLCHEGVVAIPKASTVAHMVENCGASDWRLSPDQFHELNEAIRFRRRSFIDQLVRRFFSNRLREPLLKLVRHLPPSIRRRIS